jgi:hypothetical protein
MNSFLRALPDLYRSVGGPVRLLGGCTYAFN